jgi:hypothetical protein
MKRRAFLIALACVPVAAVVKVQPGPFVCDPANTATGVYVPDRVRIYGQRGYSEIGPWHFIAEVDKDQPVHVGGYRLFP